MNLERIIAMVMATPWAIQPDTLAFIMEVLFRRHIGIRLSQAEIEARIGAAPAGRAPRESRAGAVAVLRVSGIIAHRIEALEDVSGDVGTSTELFGQRFRAAIADTAVGSILIDVDSPGGTVGGVPELAAEIMAARGTKPIVAIVNTQASSAAYWIASAADEIVATPSSALGSIGVFTAHEDKSAFFEKEGIATTLISAGDFKVEDSPFAPLSDDARAHLQTMVNDVFAMFVRDVAKGRGVSAKDVRSGFGQGRNVLAKDAVALGMADRIATFEETLTRLASGRAAPTARARALHPATASF